VLNVRLGESRGGVDHLVDLGGVVVAGLGLRAGSESAKAEGEAGESCDSKAEQDSHPLRAVWILCF
jgi:hypothetical protein